MNYNNAYRGDGLFNQSFNLNTPVHRERYRTRDKYQVSGPVIPPTWHTPTFVFAAVLVIVLLFGLWLGRSENHRLGGEGSSMEHYF